MNKDADPQALLEKSDWKLVAFDLDDTLAPSKSPLPEPMAAALRSLLDVSEVAVISGGALPQFRLQLLDNLEAGSDELSRLHLLPTCGTQYLRFDEGSLHEVYAHHLSERQREEAIQVLVDAAHELGLWEAAPWGEIIEDRGSQVTFSALGQQAPLGAKRDWDPTGEKKNALVARVAPLLPDLEVRGGGSTSVDITSRGIDKAYGMNALLDITGYGKNQMLFIGDRLDPDGNDYPVRAAGWPTFAVDGWEDTVVAVTQIATAIGRRPIQED